VARSTALNDPLITTFGRLVEAYSSLDRRLGQSLEESCGIPHTWYEVLLRLVRAEGGQLSMSALAGQVALTTGGVTRLLNRMIEAGYVERRPCPADRRVAFAALTPAGRRKVEEAATVTARDLQEAFAEFTPEDRRKFDELLDRLRAAAPPPPRPGPMAR